MSNNLLSCFDVQTISALELWVILKQAIPTVSQRKAKSQLSIYPCMCYGYCVTNVHQCIMDCRILFRDFVDKKTITNE